MMWEKENVSLQVLPHAERGGRCLIRSANLPLARLAPQPLAGAYFFGEFVASADSFLLPHLRRRSHRCPGSRIAISNGSDKQMFGAE
jgi:hypothetical protein